MSVLMAVAIHVGFGLPLPVVLGLFSGAVTNTPSLGAAQQVLKEVGASSDAWACQASATRWPIPSASPASC